MRLIIFSWIPAHWVLTLDLQYLPDANIISNRVSLKKTKHSENSQTLIKQKSQGSPQRVAEIDGIMIFMKAALLG